jgi:predicted permease
LGHSNYEDLRDRNEVFSGLLTYRHIFVSFRDGESAGEQMFAEMVSGDYFDTLGVEPAAGRTFRPDEDQTPGTHAVAVLGYGFWQRQYAGDPEVIGRTVYLNRHPFTVIGVAAEDFTGLDVGLDFALYVPAMMYRQVLADTFWHENRRALAYSVVGRLKPGVSMEQADQELDAIAAQLDEEFPEVNKDRRITLVPTLEARVNPSVRDIFAQSLGMMMVVVAMVLLVACANVANLLLSRAAGRRREIAVRLALGANRLRLIRQLLTESILLAALGGLMGLLVARWTTSLLISSFPDTPFPLALNFDLDAVVLAFAFAVSLVTGVICGMAPALQSSRPDMVPALKADGAMGEGSGRRFGLRNVLVVAQVAICLVLLIAAGLFIRSVQNAQNIDPGFDVDNALVLALDAGLEGYSPDEGRLFYRDLIERVSSLPGVRTVTVAQSLPLAFGTISRTTFIEGQEGGDEDGRLIQCGSVGLGYFDNMGIRIV